MSKRFTDSEKFKDVWYRKLTPKQKCIWEFILSECNHAGIIELDLEFASFVIGETVTDEDLIPFKNKIQKLSEEKEIYFISNFIEFQYGKLNPQSKVHASVIKELEKYSIYTLSKGLDKSMQTLKDKEKDKDKDKDKEKEKEKEIVKKVDPFINPIKTFFTEEYTKVFGKTPRLSFLECQRLTELASENPDIREIIPEAIKKLKVLRFDGISFSPSASWLLKANNFERLLNGEFDAPETEYERLKRKFGGS